MDPTNTINVAAASGVDCRLASERPPRDEGNGETLQRPIRRLSGIPKVLYDGLNTSLIMKSVSQLTSSTIAAAYLLCNQGNPAFKRFCQENE
jgi:hypothetical protein